MEMDMKFIMPGILLVFTLAFGFWLSRLGKPYNGLLFNVHKLAALGTVILAAFQTCNLLKGASVPWVVIALAAICVVCSMALFATGAFMSIGNLPHVPLLTIHKIALTVLPFALTGMVYFLVRSIR